ncbi:hypothetical protein [Candidatus Solirubrobacter pratensis]|uniref:hypothetical protein n=1 Tax=Candidatus Solirubrobacter pratensis TaxID=1298857 RepID=UPI00040A6034|nr:hypothetical protein [Candidatus Solirubrobacter pratensis]
MGARAPAAGQAGPVRDRPARPLRGRRLQRPGDALGPAQEALAATPAPAADGTAAVAWMQTPTGGGMGDILAAIARR